jgi:SAM-dependent methyltransferase
VLERGPTTSTPRDGQAYPTRGGCRFCGARLSHVFADLGVSPLANSYLTPEALGEAELFYPLRALVCAECLLVQLEEYESPAGIFSEYAYFSSYSSSWMDHARHFAELAIARFGLGPDSHVVELGSNDGYLLQHFRRRGVSIIGVEPAANVAMVATERGIPTLVEFFGRDTATKLAADSRADLVLGLNVLAHAPDLNDFVAGIEMLLGPEGVAVLEFPHLQRLIEGSQFDTIYHEHFSYFSFHTVRRILAHHGLTVFDVEELSTHGGSLRIYVRHEADASKPVDPSVGDLARRESEAGLDTLEPYLSFGAVVAEVKRHLLEFLIGLRQAGKTVVGYGAPAKGNTLLNYCGVSTDLLDYTVDASPHKQGRYLPGSRIAIEEPGALARTRPDVVLILPWNLREEIVREHAYVREWGGRFAVPVPRARLIE